MDDRLLNHKITEEEIPNLLDNFRIILQGYAYSITEKDCVSIHEIKQFAKYFYEKTGIDLPLTTRWGKL